MILRLDFRQPFFKLLNARGIGRMRPQENRCAVPALLGVVLHEPLPELHCPRRIVTGARLVDQPDVVGLGFLRATDRRENSNWKILGLQPPQLLRVARTKVGKLKAVI